MARAKTKSDEIYNARRRAKRAVARLEREIGGYSKRQAAAAKKYITKLNEQIAKSYSPQRGGVRGISEGAEKAAAVLRESVKPSKSADSVESRRNRIFERELRTASSGAPSAIAKSQDLGQAYAKIFYRATQSIWQGAPPEERNRRILAGLGESDLERAFVKVLMANRIAVRFARSQVRGIERGFDTEEEWFFEEPGDVDEYASPDYIGMVASM